MSTIAEAAAAALAAEQAAAAELEQQLTDALVDVVRQTIGTRLAPLDAAGLEVLHVDLDSDVAVLTDGAVCLAGNDEGLLHVVADDDGWTRLSPPLRSLAHLGEHLAGGA